VVPYIVAADVEDRLDWLALADALAEGHRGPAPLIKDQFLARGADTLLSRAASIEGLGIAVKSVTVVPGNAARGLPTVHGALVLFDDLTGEVSAIVDSALVTKWKTAADSILGARLLARPESRRLLILGAGAVAESLIDAYRAAFPGIEPTIWSRDPVKAEALASRRGVSAARDLPAAAAAADIVATATMASEPLLRGAWLRPGQHLDLIGAYKADMREADDDCLRASRIFVDSFDTTLDHIGELRDPLARGVIGRADVLGDLRDLVAGRAGRGGADEITLFKNGGGAHLDLMTAQVILRAWRG
jgi:ornithine cyclodeaminase/alanine dehydrogenase-like protein (mu-crystallin family)